ncbi:MAG TPA: flippase-like domain-containing protein, partial [Nitrospirae bacterium]|nr:flippase-like domain-containing protein [Nitrospirota bacterium]
FSAGFMAFLLWRVDWEHFSLIAGRLDIKGMLIAFGVFILANLVRTHRFYLLDHTGEKLARWWIINQFYNFITATLPGGAGEAATVYVLKRFSMFNILSAMRILLLTRLMDLAALSGLFCFAAVQMNAYTPYRKTAIMLSGILSVLSMIALVPAIERLILRMMRKLPGRMAIIQRVSGKLDELARIAEGYRKGNYLGVALLQSALIMAGSAVSVHLLFRAIGVDFTPVQSFYCFGVYAFFQIVPVQGIAGIGTQAAWWSLALNAAGYQGPDAIAIGFVMHGAYYLFITVLGFPSILIWLKEKRENKR